MFVNRWSLYVFSSAFLTVAWYGYVTCGTDVFISIYFILLTGHVKTVHLISKMFCDTNLNS